MMCPDITYHNEMQLPKKELQMMPFFEEKKEDKKIGIFSARHF